jgi:hypothetical protein
MRSIFAMADPSNEVQASGTPRLSEHDEGFGGSHPPGFARLWDGLFENGQLQTAACTSADFPLDILNEARNILLILLP